MVNFLGMFCPELQKLPKPIYDLTRKGRPFIWGKNNKIHVKKLNVGYVNLQFYTCQIELVDFICILTPVNLLLEVALYQIQNGKPKSIAYASKGLPEAARNYSIPELEMCGLAIIIASFSHLLKRVDLMQLLIIYLLGTLSKVKQNLLPLG